MTGPATVTTSGDGVVAVSGELDIATTPTVRGSLLDALGSRAGTAPAGRGTTTFVLDLTGVAFMASTALAMLLDVAARATAAGLELVVVLTPGSSSRQALTRTGLDTQFDVRSSLDEV